MLGAGRALPGAIRPVPVARGASATDNAAVTVARMWESRLVEERVAAFFAHVAGVAWPTLTALPGFAGGEVYRSMDGEPRAVLVTRWADAAAAAAAVAVESALGAFCAREPHAWQFAQLDL